MLSRTESLDLLVFVKKVKGKQKANLVNTILSKLNQPPSTTAMATPPPTANSVIQDTQVVGPFVQRVDGNTSPFWINLDLRERSDLVWTAHMRKIVSVNDYADGAHDQEFARI